MRRLLVVCVFGGLLLFACSKEASEVAEDRFAEGMKQLERLQFTEADSTFAKIGLADSSTVMGAYGMALVLERKLALYDALHAYLLIADRQPDFAPAFAGAARVFEWLGEPIEAQLAAKRNAILSPNSLEAQVLLARISIEAGLYGAADTAIQTAQQLGLAEGTVALLRALGELRMSRSGAAEALAGPVLAAADQSPAHQMVAADYLEERGLVDSAMAVSRRSIGSDSGSFDRLMAHVRRGLRVKYLNEVRRVADSLRLIDSSRVLTTALDLYRHWEAGDFHHADQASAEYVRLVPFRITPLLYDGKSRQMLGEAYSAQQNLDDILVYLAKIAPCEEFKDFMLYYAAVWYNRLPDRVYAMDKARIVPGWRANKRDLKIALAQSQYSTGLAEQYKALRDSIMRYRGNDPTWQTALGVACSYNLIQLYADAEENFRQALTVAPENWPAFREFVRMYTDRKQFDMALKRFEEFPFFAGFYPEAALVKAWCLLETRKVDEALAMFEQKVPFLKEDLRPYDRMMAGLLRADLTDKMRQMADLMVRMNPGDPAALTRIARLELEGLNNQASLEWAEKAVALDSTNLAAAALRGGALYGLGRRDEAFAQLEGVLAKDDGEVEANLLYSRILAEEKVDLKRAGNLARQAVFYARSELRTQMNLCYVYEKSERFDLMRGEAMKSIGNYPDEPLPQFNLGVAMYHEKNPGARKQLEKAIAMGLYGPSLARARELLAGK